LFSLCQEGCCGRKERGTLALQDKLTGYSKCAGKRLSGGARLVILGFALNASPKSKVDTP
jgi:hypothetical protein